MSIYIETLISEEHESVSIEKQGPQLTIRIENIDIESDMHIDAIRMLLAVIDYYSANTLAKLFQCSPYRIIAVKEVIDEAIEHGWAEPIPKDKNIGLHHYFSLFEKDLKLNS